MKKWLWVIIILAVVLLGAMGYGWMVGKQSWMALQESRIWGAEKYTGAYLANTNSAAYSGVVVYLADGGQTCVQSSDQKKCVDAAWVMTTSPSGCPTILRLYLGEEEATIGVWSDNDDGVGLALGLKDSQNIKQLYDRGDLLLVDWIARGGELTKVDQQARLAQAQSKKIAELENFLTQPGSSPQSHWRSLLDWIKFRKVVLPTAAISAFEL